MERLLESLKGINVNFDTQSLVEMARYWFWKDVIENIVIGTTLVLVLGGITLAVFIVVKNYGIGKWKG